MQWIHLSSTGELKFQCYWSCITVPLEFHWRTLGPLELLDMAKLCHSQGMSRSLADWGGGNRTEQNSFVYIEKGGKGIAPFEIPA